VLNEPGGIPMTLSCLSVTQRAPQEAFDSDKVRTLIADYLGIDAKRVTDEAHFSEFGMDRYDRLELMILIDTFTGVEIKDDDQIEVVGDLIRHIKGNNEQGRKLIRLA
jgi:acyl carrier protein